MRRAKSFIICLLVVLMSGLGARSSSADVVRPIPEGNQDLESIRASAAILQDWAAECEASPCPVIDCAETADILQQLRDLEAALGAMSGWLDAANADFLENHESIVGQSEITGTNLAFAEDALAIQEYLLNLGSILLDIASVADFLENIKKESAELDDAIRSGDASKLDKFGDLAKYLDGLYEGLKDLESLLDALLDQFVETEGTGAVNDVVDKANEQLGTDGLTDVNSLKSDVSDLVSILEEIRDGFRASGGAGKLAKLKDAFKNVNPRTVGQFIGRILKGIAENDLDERKGVIEDLYKAQISENGENATVGKRFIDWQAVSARRYLAEDTLAAVRSAYAALSACMTRLCPGATFARPPAEREFDTWGEALIYYNNLIAAKGSDLRSKASSYRVRTECPTDETATSCPPCDVAFRRLRSELDSYYSALREAEAGRGDGTLEWRKRDVDEAWDALVQCVTLLCSGSDLAESIGRVPGTPPVTLVEKAACPACQHIEVARARIRAAIDQRRAEIEELQNIDLDALKDHLGELEAERAEILRQLSELREQVRDSGIAGVGQDRELIAQVQSLSGEMRRLTREIDSAQREIDSVEERRSTDIPRLEREIEQLREDLRTLRRRLEECEEMHCKEPPPALDEGAEAFSLLFAQLLSTTPLDGEGGLFTPDELERIIPSAPGGGGVPTPARADLEVEKFDSADPVDAPGLFTYTIQIDNKGPDDAINLVIEDTLPPGVDFVLAEAQFGNCQRGQPVVCTIGGLPAGERTFVEITVEVSEMTPANLQNNVTVRSDTSDPNSLNNTASESTTVRHALPSNFADFVLGKESDKSSALPGEMIQFSLDLQNLGPADGTNVMVTDMLPSGLTFDNAFPSQGNCSFLDGSVTCNFGMVANGGSANVLVDTFVRDSATGPLTNTAFVQADQDDPDSSNNTAGTTVTIEEPVPTEADVFASKIDSKDPVEPGETLTYTIDITNAGPADATNVQAIDNLPANVSVTNVSTTQGSCSAGAEAVSCSLGTIPPDGVVTIEIEVQVSSSAPDGTLNNVVVVPASETDPFPGNNSADEQTQVQSPMMPLCALGIMPGTYGTSLGNCGSSGMIDVSCSNPNEVILADGFTLECDSSGNCGDNNTIFGVPNHRCRTENQDGTVCVLCEQLDGNGTPAGPQCSECFEKQ